MLVHEDVAQVLVSFFVFVYAVVCGLTMSVRDVVVRGLEDRIYFLKGGRELSVMHSDIREVSYGRAETAGCSFSFEGIGSGMFIADSLLGKKRSAFYAYLVWCSEESGLRIVNLPRWSV